MDDGNITLVDQTDTEKCKGETQGMDLRGQKKQNKTKQKPVSGVAKKQEES